jgi:hypothetical protein
MDELDLGKENTYAGLLTAIYTPSIEQQLVQFSDLPRPVTLGAATSAKAQKAGCLKTVASRKAGLSWPSLATDRSQPMNWGASPLTLRDMLPHFEKGTGVAPQDLGTVETLQMRPGVTRQRIPSEEEKITAGVLSRVLSSLVCCFSSLLSGVVLAQRIHQRRLSSGVYTNRSDIG